MPCPVFGFDSVMTALVLCFVNSSPATIIILLSTMLIDLAVQTPASHGLPWPRVSIDHQSPFKRELDLGRRRRIIRRSNDRGARRKRRRDVERAALTQDERAEAGCQRWWAGRGCRRRRRGLCGRCWRLGARVELCPTWTLAVRF